MCEQTPFTVDGIENKSVYTAPAKVCPDITLEINCI